MRWTSGWKSEKFWTSIYLILKTDVSECVHSSQPGSVGWTQWELVRESIGGPPLPGADTRWHLIMLLEAGSSLFFNRSIKKWAAITLGYREISYGTLSNLICSISVMCIINPLGLLQGNWSVMTLCGGQMERIRVRFTWFECWLCYFLAFRFGPSYSIQLFNFFRP